jgi:hypothetical protein
LIGRAIWEYLLRQRLDAPIQGQHRWADLEAENVPYMMLARPSLDPWADALRDRVLFWILAAQLAGARR